MGTNSWDWRVNMSIFGISVVYTYNVSTEFLAYEETSCVLLYYFSEEIIDNSLY